MSGVSAQAARLDDSRPGVALNRWDVLCLAALVAVGVWFALDSVIVPATMRQDNLQYILMAQDPGAFFWVGSIYAQRVLPPLLVWCGTKLFGLSVAQGFRLVCAASYIAFLTLFYLVLRRGRAAVPIAWGTALFSGICFWPMTYSMGNIYQACDAMTYPFGLAIVALTLRRKLVALVIVSVLAVMTRQQLFVLACLAFVALYVQTRDRRALAGLAAIVFFFAMLVGYAGLGGGASTIAGHTVLRALDFRAVARGLVETKFPVMFTPFLLVLICFGRQTLGYIRKYWWAALFAVITVAQPLVAFPITGPSNAQRLAMLGAWLAFWPAGLLLRDCLRTRWAMWVYAALPLLYGTRHLTHLKHAYPCPLGHRTVMNGVLLLLVLVELHRHKEPDRAMPEAGSGGGQAA